MAALAVPLQAVLFSGTALALDHEPDRVGEALRRSEGNISASARLLGLHRTQLKRLLTKYGVQVSGSRADVLDEDEEP